MQAERTVMPEFDRNGPHPESRPVWRTRHVSDRIFGRIEGDRSLESETRFERARLLRRPGTDPAVARARSKIGVGFSIAYHFDQASDPHLAVQRLPMEAQSRFLRREKLTSLLAFEIGVEHEAALIQCLEKHHA